jgi:UPF0176 protein
MGFGNVGALKGGIVNYYQYVQANNLTSRFQGVNHVFDQRLGQRVGDKILSQVLNPKLKTLDQKSESLN